MKRISIAIFMTLLFNTTSFAQLKNSSEVISRIESYLTEYEKLGFAGTVLIELDGTVVISKGYGLGMQNSK
ncbi:MAG: hypothetical protein IPL22_22495 [Bacteroidetes bacterium]|nr:hypothetical protein [Bacteroidota bacterium]